MSTGRFIFRKGFRRVQWLGTPNLQQMTNCYRERWWRSSMLHRLEEIGNDGVDQRSSLKRAPSKPVVVHVPLHVRKVSFHYFHNEVAGCNSGSYLAVGCCIDAVQRSKKSTHDLLVGTDSIGSGSGTWSSSAQCLMISGRRREENPASRGN